MKLGFKGRAAVVGLPRPRRECIGEVIIADPIFVVFQAMILFIFRPREVAGDIVVRWIYR